jgi:hypothetical protein
MLAGVIEAAPRPLLLMDVDGVLNPYPDCPDGFTEYDFFPEDDEPVRLAAIHREWLHDLAESFTMVWATGWGPDANRLLCPHFGLPELPVISFPPVPFDPAAKVQSIAAFTAAKVPAIADFATEHAVAWVDDVVTPEARRWAQARSYPTLLVEVDHRIGLTRDDVDSLLAWRLSLA